jgi:hypothetical protein
MAVALMAQDNCPIPTPTGFAHQSDGGILSGTEPITLCDESAPELYYFYRDGVMIGFGVEPTFLDYPGYGIFAYQVQISVNGIAGDLSEPVLVEIIGEIPPAE